MLSYVLVTPKNEEEEEEEEGSTHQLLLNTPSIASCIHSPFFCCRAMINYSVLVKALRNGAGCDFHTLMPLSIGALSGYAEFINAIHAHAVLTT